MDPTTASYYRAVLFTDGTTDEPIPPSLMVLHKWALKRHLALGLGGSISKAVVFSIVMTWLSATKDGRAFARDKTPLGELFTETATDPVVETTSDVPVLSAEEWDTLPENSKVMVTLADSSRQIGEFVGRRGKWIDVRIEGEQRPFQTKQVQLVGA